MTAFFQKNSRTQIRVVRDEYKGRDIVNVREWFITDDGEYRPSQRGITLKPDQVEQLQQILDQVKGGGE